MVTNCRILDILEMPVFEEVRGGFMATIKREFYEKECISEGWTVDELHRQKESGLFMRLAVSKDKEGVLTLAHEGQQVQTPEDVVKNTYTLEFLGIEERKRYKEKERSTTR